MQVTSLEQLKKVKQTEIIELGKFEDGTPLIAEVKQPDLMALMTGNKVPNSLLKSAMKVFNGKAREITDKIELNDEKALKEMAGLMEVFAKECLVKPSYKEIKDCGLELTMEMKLSILTFTQGGIQALEGFRTEQEHNKDNQSSN
nr:MAG TPA: hypothetical protein [Caudoviricetes sp.]